MPSIRDQFISCARIIPTMNIPIHLIPSKREQQENDADFGPLLHCFLAGQVEEPKMRPDHETGYYVPQDKRLLERLGKQSEHTCRNQDNGKVFYEIQFFRHMARSVTATIIW